MRTPRLVDPPLELSLFQDSEKRPLVVVRPGPDVPDATDESSWVERARSLRWSLRSAHFFLEAIGGGNGVTGAQAVLRLSFSNRWHLHCSTPTSSGSMSPSLLPSFSIQMIVHDKSVAISSLLLSPLPSLECLIRQNGSNDLHLLSCTSEVSSQ